MAYILESNLPDNKSVKFALNFVFGIGKKKSYFICKNLGFSSNLKLKMLSKDQITRLIKMVEMLNLDISSDLKKSKLLNEKRLVRIKSYKGLRKTSGLPVRGQRTHTNARTSKKIR